MHNGFLSRQGKPSFLSGWFQRDSAPHSPEQAQAAGGPGRNTGRDPGPATARLLFLSPSPDERTAFAARVRALASPVAVATRASSEPLAPDDAAAAVIIIDCRQDHDAIMRIRGELDLLDPSACPMIVPLVRTTKADRAWAIAIGADGVLGHPYDDADLCFLFKAAGRAAGLMQENARLRSGLDEAARDAQGLRTLAYTDHLTGLPNRLYLLTWLDEIIASREAGPQFALHMLDLDGFKQVNDLYGHRAGDEILRQVAGRVTKACRRLDLVVRLGGDEIVIVQAGVASDKDCTAFTARVLQTFQAPFIVDDIETSVGASIGSAIFPADGDTVSALLHHADLAMYTAKPPGMDRASNDGGDRSSEMAAARLAMEQGDYAPAYELGTGKLAGVVCVAENGDETGDRDAISPLLRLACLQSAHRSAAHPGIVFSAPVGPAALDRDDLLTRLRDLLTDTGAEPSGCEIVITASDLDREPELWHQIRELGYGLGVLVETDDFSPQRLLRVPLTRLHLGPGFARSASPEGRVLLGMAVMFAHAVYAGTLAHGVVAADQVERLREVGVDCAAGPLAGAPVRGRDLPPVWRQPVHDWTVDAAAGLKPA